MKENKKTSIIIATVLAIIAVVVLFIILRSMYYGTNGFGIGILTVCFTAILARGILELADSYLIKSQKAWAMVVKWIGFLLIPWILLNLGIFYLGIVLNDYAVNKKHEERILDEIIGKAEPLHGKLSTIDSLICIYGEANKDYVSTIPVSKLEAQLSPDAIKDIKAYEEVAQLLKDDHEHYLVPDIDSLNAPSVLLWFCNSESNRLRTGKPDSAYPMADTGFKMADLTNNDSIKKSISDCFAKGGIVLWNDGIDAFSNLAEDALSADYLVFVNYEYVLEPKYDHVSHFIGGAISARLSLWDFSRQSFTDTLHVYTENSDKINSGRTYNYEAGRLYDDLRNNLYKDVLVTLSKYKP